LPRATMSVGLFYVEGKTKKSIAGGAKDTNLGQRAVDVPPFCSQACSERPIPNVVPERATLSTAFRSLAVLKSAQAQPAVNHKLGTMC
jgi:hypothetical protein